MSKKAVQKQQRKDRARKYRKIALIAISVVIVLALAGTIIAYLFSQNSIPKDILRSLQNTTNIQEMKFHATLTNPKSEDGTTNTVTIEGLLKKGAGLSAVAESVADGNGTKGTKKSNWVIDAKGDVYANISLFDFNVVDQTKANTSLTPDIIQKMIAAMQVNTNANKDVWTKFTAKNFQYSYIYGVQACLLSTFYKVQSNPGTFQDLIKLLAGPRNFKVESTSADTYTIVPNESQFARIGSLYTESNLYKTLVACDKLHYAATNQSTIDILGRTTVKMTIDSANKRVSSFTVAIKGGSTFTATLAPTSGVKITTPTIKQPPQPTSSDTAETYMQTNAPYLYKNLMNMKERIAQGLGPGE